MLGFGLTLLGGCVATTETGQPSELYFPAHSVTPQNAVFEEISAPLPASAENMAKEAHLGLYILENITKTGSRYSDVCWGIYNHDDGVAYRRNTFAANLCACLGSTIRGARTHVQSSVVESSRGIYDDSNIIFYSGDGLTASRFSLDVHGGSCFIESGFSGTELRRPLSDVLAHSGRETLVMLFRFPSRSFASFDFVISAYCNEGLGVNVLSLPMRTTPTAFGGEDIAVFEFQNKHLYEL